VAGLTPYEWGLALLKLGFWIICIRARGEPKWRKAKDGGFEWDRNPDGTPKLCTGKEPVGFGWGLVRWTVDRLFAAFYGKSGRRKDPGRGIGVGLGADRCPGGGDLADLEGDGEGAAESLATLLGSDEPPNTPSWGAARGGHYLFRVELARLLDLLTRAGAKEKTGNQAGVYHLEQFPGLEVRCGGHFDSGRVKQLQSVCPPSLTTAGVPREWTVPPDVPVMPLPEHAYAFLERLALEAEARRAAEGETAASAPKLTPAEKAARYLAKALPTADEPDRLLLLSVVIGRAGPRHDIPEAECVDLVLEHYAPRCNPTWSADEVKAATRDTYAETPERGVRLLGKKRTFAEGWDTPFEPLEPDVEEAVIRFIDRWPASIEGDHGSNKTFGLVTNVGRGFDLTKNQCLHYVETCYNVEERNKKPRCVPPWDRDALRHKIDGGYERETRRGWLNIKMPSPGGEWTWEGDLEEVAHQDALAGRGVDLGGRPGGGRPRGGAVGLPRWRATSSRRPGRRPARGGARGAPGGGHRPRVGRATPGGVPRG
jgi:hypothetical protein